MRLIQNPIERDRVVFEHSKRKFGNRDGDLVLVPYGTPRLGTDDDGPTVSTYVIAAGSSGRFYIKVGRRFTRYYDEGGVLVHEEYTGGRNGR